VEGERSLSVAHDAALGRAVLIHHGGVEDGVHPDRAVRLRWLRGGVGATGQRWDAFEAPAGEALLAHLERTGPVGWDRVRRWLLQLTDEIARSLGAGELPQHLSLRRIWIDENDNLKLWPFSAVACSDAELARAGDLWPQFLEEFARAALAGRAGGAGDAELHLPAHATHFLAGLAEAMPDAPTALRLIEQLQLIQDVPAGLERSQRIRHLVYTYTLPWTAGGVLGALLARESGWYALNGLMLPVLPVALLAIASACVVPGGGAMWLFGMTLQDRRGRTAGRARSGWRALIAWSPLLTHALVVWLTINLAAFAARSSPDDSRFAVRASRAIVRAIGIIPGDSRELLARAAAWVALFLVIVYAAGAVVAMRHPARSWQDRIAGTRVVAR
jgi:hypothetical protein